MPALAVTLNQLAAALLGAGAYIYHTSQRDGWKACAIVCGTRIERSSPDPYAALGAVAQVLIDYEAQQVAQDAYDTPAARAAYRHAWAATEGQPVAARFAAAEAAAAASGDKQPEEKPCLWIRRMEAVAAGEPYPEDDEAAGSYCARCEGKGLGGPGCPQCGTRCPPKNH